MSVIWKAREAEAPEAGVLVLLHGRGADENDLLPVAARLPAHLRIVTLRAPLALGMGYQWYQMGADGTPEAAGLATSLDLVESFLAEQRTPRLWIGGFSQGALMAALITVRGQARGLVGTVCWSGYLPANAPPAELNGYPVFWGHGTADPVLPIARGRDAVSRLTQWGARVTFREYPIGHGLSEAELADVTAWMKETETIISG